MTIERQTVSSFLIKNISRNTGNMLKHLIARIPRWDRILAIILMIVIVISGLYIDVKGWFVNISAGIAGIFIGFLIAILFLDQYQKKIRKEQWDKVRLLTYRSLTAHSMDIVNQAIIHYSPLLSEATKDFARVQGRRLRPSDTTKKIIRNLLDDLNKVPPSAQRKKSKLTVKLFDNIKWDLDKISDILTPRVLQFSDNNKVIDALVHLDYARDQFENYIIVERNNSLGIDFLHFNFLLYKIDELLEILAQDWKYDGIKPGDLF